MQSFNHAFQRDKIMTQTPLIPWVSFLQNRPRKRLGGGKSWMPVRVQSGIKITPISPEPIAPPKLKFDYFKAFYEKLCIRHKLLCIVVTSLVLFSLFKNFRETLHVFLPLTHRKTVPCFLVCGHNLFLRTQKLTASEPLAPPYGQLDPSNDRDNVGRVRRNQADGHTFALEPLHHLGVLSVIPSLGANSEGFSRFRQRRIMSARPASVVWPRVGALPCLQLMDLIPTKRSSERG